MTIPRLLCAVVVTLCGARALAQSDPNAPHVGYAYPAGGQRGTTFRVIFGGQNLRGASGVHVSGPGVRATVLQQYPPMRALDKAERAALAERFRPVFQQRWAELQESGRVTGALPAGVWGSLGLGPARNGATFAAENQGAKAPDHPLLYDLEHQSLRELVHAAQMLRNASKGQRNPQLAGTVLVEVTIERDAEPGGRELRVLTPQGLTNPLRFEVGAVPEVREFDVGQGPIVELLPEEPPLELPATINGQIMPGDVDAFRFRARQGQRLVFQVLARQLIPYLADAVPGWFQATLAVYDAAGAELAFVDDYTFAPDPVLCYDVPADGEYQVEIRDAIYRGREDFVYRLSVGERPFITSIFPLGCRVDQQRYVAVAGWNLYSQRLFIDGRSHTEGIWLKPLGRGSAASNAVAYSVNAWPADVEQEDNNTLANAQTVRLPRILDGRIEQPGDVDNYEFTAKAGTEIVVEAVARRVRSPLDALVRLLDASGTVVEWNDDFEHKDGFLHMGMGDLTHSADSFLRVRLPADGTYYVQITDVQAQGGPACAYRLRIGPPRPDFELRVAPASINVRAGLSAAMQAYALRKDGFDGAIEIVLQDGPPGFTLSGARIPAGRDSVRFTLNAPVPADTAPLPLTITGTARIDGECVAHPAVPTEDMMQAFLYQHLVPAQELSVVALGGRRVGRPFELTDEAPVRIPVAGVTTVHVRAPRQSPQRALALELREPPPGLTLQNLTAVADGLTFELAAGPDVTVGLADNLIVAAIVESESQQGGKSPSSQKRRVALGVLPAIPFQVVPQ